MSNYCTESDLLTVLTSTELAQLADHDEDGSADADVITRACAEATDRINSYISPRYTLPLDASATTMLKRVAVRLAIYYLHVDRRSVTEDIKDQHKADIAWLRDVQAGKATLGDPANAASGDPAPAMKFDNQDRVFKRDDMTGF